VDIPAWGCTGTSIITGLLLAAPTHKFHCANFRKSVARLGEKAPIRFVLANVDGLKFGFGALLVFGLLFETLTTTLGDLRRLFAGNIFRYNVAKSQSIQC